MEPYTKTVEFISKKYDELIKRVESLENENKELKSENFNHKKLIVEGNQTSKNDNNILQSRMNVLASTINHLEASIDELEQYTRRECMEISGIPVEEDEDTTEIVQQVARLVDLDIRGNEISTSHRLPPGKPWTDKEGKVHQPKPPAIIAKLVCRDDPTEFYNSHFKLKGKSTYDLDCISTGISNSIFISESLNPSRKKLFRSCLKVKKELDFRSISTHNGQIFLKKDRSTPSTNINNLSDLAKLKSAYS